MRGLTDKPSPAGTPSIRGGLTPTPPVMPRIEPMLPVPFIAATPTRLPDVLPSLPGAVKQPGIRGGIERCLPGGQTGYSTLRAEGSVHSCGEKDGTRPRFLGAAAAVGMS